MSIFARLPLVFREQFGRRLPERVPEPSLVMDDPQQVADYFEACSVRGLMGGTYLFHTIQMCQVIAPGDVVVDLACGPAAQLAQVAQLNPDAQFVGVDLSPAMLERAGEHIASLGLTNVELRTMDITDLADFEDGTIDAVVSSMSLHHLPNEAMLMRTAAEMRRVLKIGGGVYLADFARLHSERSMDFFAHQHQPGQPALYTRDFANSLRAAFSLEQLQAAADAIASDTRLSRMAVVTLLAAIRTPTRHALSEALCERLRKLHGRLPPSAKADFRGIVRLFKRGGLATPEFLTADKRR